MNKIYRVIWNKVTQRFVVVSELAKAGGKSGSKKLSSTNLISSHFALTTLSTLLLLASTPAAHSYTGIYINDYTDDGCTATWDGSGQTGIYTIQPNDSGTHVYNSNPSNSVTPPTIDNFVVGVGNPCLSSGTQSAENKDKQTNRTLFYGRNENPGTAHNGAMNLSLGGRLDVNSGIIGVGDRGVNGNNGTNSIRIGTGKTLLDDNKKENAITIGIDSIASEENALAIGSSAKAAHGRTVAIGKDASATSYRAVALGENSKADGEKSTALGAYAHAKGNQSVALGGGVANGAGANAEGDQSIAIGGNVNAQGNSSIAIGGDDLDNIANNNKDAVNKLKELTDITIEAGKYLNTRSSGDASVAIGMKSMSKGALSVTLGTLSESNALASVAIGTGANATKENAIALGAGSNTMTSAKPISNAVVKSINENGQVLDNSALEFNYNNFAGGTNLKEGDQVSVGSAGYERQIKNVAPGEISATSTDAINGSQLAMVAGKLQYQSQGYFHVNENRTEQETGNSTTNFGKLRQKGGAQGPYSIAAGVNAKANGTSGIAIGKDAHDKGFQGIAIGGMAETDNSSGVALGYRARTLKTADGGGEQVAIGANTTVKGRQSVVVGNDATANGDWTIVLGTQYESGRDKYHSDGNSAVSIGSAGDGGRTIAESDANYSVAVGTNAKTKAEATHSVAIGDSSLTKGINSLALGHSSKADVEDGIAIGYLAKTDDDVILDPNVPDSYIGSIAIGRNSHTSGKAAIAMGLNTEAYGRGAVAIGDYADAKSTGQAIAVGAGSISKGVGSIALGSGSSTERDLAVTIGSGSKALVSRGVALGAASVSDVAAGQVGADPLEAGTDKTTSTWKATTAAVSVGKGTEITRQITSLAAGTKDTDAVNVAQLKAAGFNLTTSKSTGEVEGTSIEKIKNGETLTVDSGKNIKLTQAKGKITVATKDEVTFNKTTVGSVITNQDTNTIVGLANKVLGDAKFATEGRAATEEQLNKTQNNLVTLLGGNAKNDSGNVTMTDIGGTGKGNIHDALNLLNDNSQGYFHVNENRADQQVGDAETNFGYIRDKAGATGAHAVTAGVNAKAKQIGGVAVGHNAIATKAGGIAIGHNVKSEGEHAVVIGGYGRNSATGEYAISMGYTSEASSNYSISLGRFTKASGAQAVAIGHETKATAIDATAFGRSTEAKGSQSTAMGLSSVASGDSSTAMGNFTLAEGFSSTAMGIKTKAEGVSSTAMGQSSIATGAVSIAMGAGTKAKGALSTAMGYKSEAIGIGSLATGGYAGKDISRKNGGKAYTNGSMALGAGTVAGKDKGTEEAVAIGYDAQATANKSIALGFDAKATHENSVALGEQAETKVFAQVNTATVGSLTYSGFAGTANGVVSIGKAGFEKQIVNVAPGEISATSTDAINGSQLHATNNVLGNLANTTKNILGGDADLDKNGNITMSDIGGTGKGNIHDAIKAATTVVKSSDKSISVTKAKDANEYDITVDAQKLTNDSQLPVVYTKADGTKVYKQANGTFNTKADGSGDAIDKGDIITSLQGADDSTTTPTTLANVKGNLVETVNGAVGVATLEQKAPTKEEAGKIVNNAATVGDILNAGWNLQNNGDAKDFVKAYDTVNFVDGKNSKAKVTVKEDGTIADVTYDVDLSAATDNNPFEYAKADGTPIVKLGDKYYPEGTTLDAKGNPVAADGTTPAVALPDADAGKVIVKAKGKAKPITNVKSGLENYTTAEAPTAKAENLVNLGDNTVVKDDTVATVGDLRNMGWVVSASDSKYSETVKNANEVDFVGTGLATVTGKTDGNKRTITVDVNAQKLTNASQLPVVYTKADGTKVYKQEDGTFNTKPDGKGDAIDKSDIITSLQGADGSTTKPTKLSNVADGDISKTSKDAVNGSQLFDTNNKVDGNTTALGGGAKYDPDTNTYTKPTYKTLDAAGNAITGIDAADNVGDALTNLNAYVNKGFDIQERGVKKGTVTPTDKVNFVDGKLTTAKVATEANGVTNITFDVDAQGIAESAQLPVVYTKADGSKVYKVGDKFFSNKDGSGTEVPPTDIIASMQNADGTTATPTTLANVKAGVKDEDAVNVSQLKGAAAALGGGAAINSDGTFKAPKYTITKTDGTTVDANNVGDALTNLNNEVVKPLTFNGDKGTFDRKLGQTTVVKGGETDESKLSDNNIGVVAKTDGDKGILEIKLAKNLKDLDSVTSKIVTAGTGANQVVLDNKGVNVGGNTYISDAGLNANDKKITNVAPGTVAKDSKDAVNGGQLFAQGEGVKNIIGGNTTYNPATGVYENTDIGGTGKGNINDAIKSVNTAAKAAKTEVTGGKNIEVTETKGANGQSIYNVKTAAEVEFDKATVGNVVIDKADDTISGLSNKTLGKDDFATKGRAATEEQLNATQDNLVTLLGGDAKNINGNVTASNIGGTGKNNLNDAIKAATTEVTSSDGTVLVSSAKNADGANVYDVKVDAQKLAESAQLPVAYTNKAGDKVYKQADGTFNTQSDGKGDTVAPADIIASMQNADGSTTKPTTLSNVANGDISPTSTDAVNGSQLFDTNNQVAGNTEALGGGAKYDSDTNTYTAPTYTVNNPANGEATTAHTVGGAVEALNSAVNSPLTFAGDKGSHSAKLGTTVNVKGDDKNISTEVTGNTLRVKLSDNITVKGATISNSLAVKKGANIDMGNNVVNNVADGEISATSKQAVNGSQLYKAQQQIGKNNYQIRQLGSRVDKLDKDLKAGIAGATAIAFLQRPNEAGKSMVSLSAGSYKSESAVAIGYARNSDNNKVSIKIGAGMNTRGDTNFGGSIGYQW